MRGGRRRERDCAGAVRVRAALASQAPRRARTARRWREHEEQRRVEREIRGRDLPIPTISGAGRSCGDVNERALQTARAVRARSSSVGNPRPAARIRRDARGLSTERHLHSSSARARRSRSRVQKNNSRFSVDSIFDDVDGRIANRALICGQTRWRAICDRKSPATISRREIQFRDTRAHEVAPKNTVVALAHATRRIQSQPD